MITVSNLTKSFGGARCVDGLSFGIADGEIFGIVGPDGAGKSTLLRLMSTLIEPDEGSVLFNGINIFTNRFQVKEKMAYMPQRFGLYEDLTVEENIYFFGKLFGMKRAGIRERLKDLYEFSRLGPFGKRLAGKLSGGMKQKLGLACSLVHKPEIIILDEPTNGVDPVSRREFWKILYDLLGSGVTIIVSTAYLDEAERCNRIALMRKGSFISIGKPEEIKASAGRPFVEFTTTDPRGSEKILKDMEGYKGIILTGSALKVFVQDPASSEAAIRKTLADANIGLADFRVTEPSLEDCFVDIIGSRQEGA